MSYCRRSLSCSPPQVSPPGPSPVSYTHLDVYKRQVQRSPFGDYRPSFTSLARGKRGKAMLQRCFGNTYLEAMERELVVVSTDLYEKTAVYHLSLIHI